MKAWRKKRNKLGRTAQGETVLLTAKIQKRLPGEVVKELILNYKKFVEEQLDAQLAVQHDS